MRIFFKTWGFIKKNIFYLTIALILILFGYYVFFPKTKIEISFESSQNFIKPKEPEKSYKRITQENLTKKLNEKIKSYFLSSIVNLDLENNKVNINPQYFRPEKINEFSKEIGYDLANYVIEDLREEYLRLVSNLKIEPTSEKNLENYFLSFESLVKKLEEIKTKEDPRKAQEEIVEFEVLFERFAKQPVPQELKEEHLNILQRIIIVKNGLKYIYSTDDPFKLIAGLYFLKNINENLIKEIFSQ